jgi:hypothetical protein
MAAGTQTTAPTGARPMIRPGTLKLLDGSLTLSPATFLENDYAAEQ